MNKRVKFALDNFIEKNYFEDQKNHYLLEEKKTTGRTFLDVTVQQENLCIQDYDNAHKCTFVRQDEMHGMCKSVDHVILELHDTKCNVHLIEMKSSVSDSTWQEIKKKTRTSYLNILALAEFLGINVEDVRLYITYERRVEEKINQTTNPMAHMPRLGERAISCQKQWEEGFIQVKIDKFKTFPHTAIKMKRTPKGLVGELKIV